MKRISFLLLILLWGCGKNRNNNYMPVYAVSTSINLDNPQYINLKTIGGAAYVSTTYAGRGIVVYRSGQDTYSAVERTCSYQYADTCAYVNINSSSTWLECKCCGSKFTFDGSILGAPATFPLRTYQTSYSPTTNTLSIYN